ncbi:MAG TPA: calcium-binding protein [Solirubrobacterales bacterium]|nr:calcium-binding protein [Solirubrobacterales bacterium]
MRAPIRRPSLRLILPAALIAAALAVPAGTAHAKVRSSVSGSLLVLRGGNAADRVRVICRSSGLVKVNGKNPRGGAVPCARISEIDALTGAGNDRIDLSGVGSSHGFGQRDLPGGFGHGTGCAAALGSGEDRYVGGATCFNLVLAGRDDDRVRGGALRDQITGGSGDDGLTSLGGRDILIGNAGNDKLNAGADDDLLSGNTGDDVLIAGAGTDLLGGGPGMDRLFGGPGADELIGGPGKDLLNGGPGNNTLIQDAPKK